MAENESGRYWDPLVMQSELSPQEKILRDRYVSEYLLDFDAWAAAVRTGFLRSVAAEYAALFMQEPYVQQQIAARLHAEEADPKTALKRKRKQTEVDLIREAHYRGPGSSHSARVQALAKLCNLYDMESATKIKKEVTHKGGVMRVPAIANIDQWEKEAMDAQQKLIESSSEDRQAKQFH